MMAKQRYNRLKEVLAKFEFSQKDLAHEFKLGEQTVSTWCRNIHQPSLQQLFAIAQFFGISNHDLIESNPLPPANDEPPYLKVKAELEKSKTDRRRTARKSTRKR